MWQVQSLLHRLGRRQSYKHATFPLAITAIFVPDFKLSDPNTFFFTDCRFSGPGAPSWIQAGPAQTFYLAKPI